jgi:3-oxoacyl-[acyl-carrier protein] reductase
MKTALVTGSGSGLGAHLSLSLAETGYDIIVHAHRNEDGAQKIAEAIRAKNQKATVVLADLTQPDQAEKLATTVREFSGSLDLLINNSGVYVGQTLTDLTPEDWFTGLHTTATATFLTTRILLPFLRQSPAGRIINLGDSSCDRPGARDLAAGYHVGKTGVWILTRSFAQSEARHGVTVNMISPGFLENSVDLPDPSTVPAGRFGTFDDITQAVHSLLAPNNPYLTGSNLVISGGWNLR